MRAKFEDVIRRLGEFQNPIIDFKMDTEILSKDLSTREEQAFRTRIKHCDTVVKLLSGLDGSGIIPVHPYAKWFGAHWVLTALAEINYPPRDKALAGLVGQVLEWLSGFRSGWKIVRGRLRTHPCLLGNAVFYLSKLGFPGPRVDDLAAMILETRWDDGGWNCDPKPEAAGSSLATTRLCLRGLHEYNKGARSAVISRVIDEAVELITGRRVFLGRKTGRVIDPKMLYLSFPAYYHYTALAALVLLKDLGVKNDDCLDPALDALEAKELPAGGFPAERKRYTVSRDRKHGSSPTGWGRTGKNTMNEYVTADALAVLRHYGRV